MTKGEREREREIMKEEKEGVFVDRRLGRPHESTCCIGVVLTIRVTWGGVGTVLYCTYVHKWIDR